MRSITALGVLLICAAAASAAELRPIVEVQSGYLFGATVDGKWLKAWNRQHANQRWSPFGAAALMEGKAIANEERTTDLEKQLKP